MDCSICSGPAYVLGVLGNRTHFRCRNCGMDFSRRAEDHHEAEPDPVEAGHGPQEEWDGAA